MELVSHLKKQPKWKIIKNIPNNKYCTGFYAHHWSGHHVNETHVEEDVPIIYGELTLHSWGRGRSSVTYEFKDKNDFSYHAGTSCAFHMMQKAIKGKVTGLFTFAKQGESVYITPLSFPSKPTKEEIAFYTNLIEQYKQD